ncbi:MAG: hypothetical protein A2Y73_08400 [Chloroflexi bacterium RBG_13_56_8]|nr:MAG: hypothetical protein A2Y73_08400 [Chloroflexi bacterium RBG_13_56_8]
MPFGNQMGPSGEGPMTGRGAGFCAGYDVPGYMYPVRRRGFGMGWADGRGGGHGWHRHSWFHARGIPRRAHFWHAPVWNMSPVPMWGPPATKEQQVEFFQEQAAWLEEQLAATGEAEGEEN